MKPFNIKIKEFSQLVPILIIPMQPPLLSLKSHYSTEAPKYYA